MSLIHKITPALKIELVQNHPERRSIGRVPDDFAQGRLQAEVHQVNGSAFKGNPNPAAHNRCVRPDPTTSERGAQQDLLPHHPLTTESGVVGPPACGCSLV